MKLLKEINVQPADLVKQSASLIHLPLLYFSKEFSASSSLFDEDPPAIYI